MTRYKLHLLILILSILVIFGVGCSSVKKGQAGISFQKRNEAAEYSRYGYKVFGEGRYKDALRFYSEALKINISVDNEAGIIKSYNSIGKIYAVVGKNKVAGEYYQKGLTLAESYGDKILLAQTLNNIGELTLKQGKTDDALKIFEESLSKIGSSAHSAVIYHNMAVTYKRLGDFDVAEEKVQLSLSINKKNKNSRELAANNYLLASIYSKKGEYEKALNYVKEALSLDKRMENSLGIAKDILAIALINQNRGEDRFAYDGFKKGLLIYEALSLPREVLKAIRYLEETADRLGLKVEAKSWRSKRRKLETALRKG